MGQQRQYHREARQHLGHRLDGIWRVESRPAQLVQLLPSGIAGKNAYLFRSRRKDAASVEMTPVPTRWICEYGFNTRTCSFTGILQGEGHEATCMVCATKVSLSGQFSAYVKYSIQNVSKALPEGGYTLSAGGGLIAVRYRNGFWMADSAP